MARRRMFSLDVVNTDKFLDLPSSSQALYFHLGMRADDEGFVSSPKRITSTVNCSADDLKLLIAKGFIIPFDSGVCVLTDWRKNNYIQSDRCTPTAFISERAQLYVTPDKSYSAVMDTPCIQDVSILDTQIRLGKDSIDKDNINISADRPQKSARLVKPTLEEVTAYCLERKNNVDPQAFIDNYDSNGWKVGRTAMKDWKASVRTWERNGKSGGKATQPINSPDKYQYGKERAL